MSVINNALSELAKKESTASIEAAVVPKVKTRSPLVWVVAGFTLSLAMGAGLYHKALLSITQYQLEIYKFPLLILQKAIQRVVLKRPLLNLCPRRLRS